MPLKRRDILAHRDAYSLLAMLLFLALCALFRRFTVDDAFISYRYARHLGDGLGLVMNAGERVEGVSNLPWTALLGLFSAIGLEPHACAPVLSVLCGLACVGLTAELAARLADDARAGGFAALLCAAAAPVAVWSVSGMETLAYTVAVLCLMLVEIRELGSPRGGLGVGLCLGLVAVMRPEGIVFGLPVLWAETAAGRAQGTRLARIALGAALVVLPLEVFRVIYFGDWLPNPVHAKGNLGLASLRPGLLYAARLVAAFPVLFLAFLLAPAAVADRGARRLLLGWVGVQLLFVVGVGGDFFAGYRFAVPALPALAAGAELCLRGLRQGMALQGRRRAWACVATGAGGVGLLLTAFPGLLLPIMSRVAVLARIRGSAAEHATLLAGETRGLGVALVGLGLWCGWLAWRGRVLVDVQTVGSVSTSRRDLTAGRAAHESRPARRAMAGAAAILLLATLAPLGFDAGLRSRRQPDAAARYGRAVGEWLRANLPAGTLVASNCAGTLPYFSELPALDMLGLTDRHIARQPADVRQWIGHERGDGAYVLQRRPGMIIFGGPEGSAGPWRFAGDQQLAASAEFRRDYELQRVPLGEFDFIFYRRRDLAGQAARRDAE